MGGELYRMIRDGAPAGWTPQMRLVALAVADDARDPSQGPPEDGGWPWSALPVRGSWHRGKWRDGLTERTGMSGRAVRRALADLAAAGYEMREAIGTDTRGRPVFAARGHALRFRVPPLRPRDPPERRPDTAERRPDLVSKAARSGTPVFPMSYPDHLTPPVAVSRGTAEGSDDGAASPDTSTRRGTERERMTQADALTGWAATSGPRPTAVARCLRHGNPAGPDGRCPWWRESSPCLVPS